MAAPVAEMTYVLPIRRTAVAADDELAGYLAALAAWLPVIVADGSPPGVFAHHAAVWPKSIVHVAVDPDRAGDLNGKVAGVVSGLRRVRTAKAVVADDDVRWDAFSLRRLADALDRADVVRPQNVFAPLPWHALLDTGRILIARATGGDWPGTLGLRMDAYERAGGAYSGDVLFENLELVRTVRAAGGRELVAYDLFVRRRPPATPHYFHQRVRQAYDEFARPGRFAVQLALAPALLLGLRRAPGPALAAFALGAMGLAELGRRRGGGTNAFGPAAALCAPAWVLERAVTSWCALALRPLRGGVRYSHGTLRVAAHSEGRLRDEASGHQARSRHVPR
jgi:hypothetical protein